jgi:hypothetical protein
MSKSKIPKLPRPGQASGREERILSYEQAFGAKVVKFSSGGLEDLGPREARRVTEAEAKDHVATIRMSLSAGADKAICSCGDPDVRDCIIVQLTDEERPKVEFSFFGVPNPTNTVHIG